MAPSSMSNCRARAGQCWDDVPVLLIDDDEDFRNGLAENLRDDGHVVQEHAGTAELPPLAALGTVGMIIIDYQLAEDNGLRFADWFHAAHPTVPIVLITAYWTHHLEAEIRARKFLHLLRKPFDYHLLHDLVHQLPAGADH